VTDLVFVVGGLHSGGNWIHDFLAAHPDVTGIKDPWTLYDERQTVERIREAGSLLFEGAATRLVVVRSVASIFMLDDLAAAWPEARFINVMRDGREAVVRIRIGRHNLDERTAHLFGTSIKDSAAAWARATEAGLAAADQLGDRMKAIRYEDVVVDRVRAGTELLAFLGLPGDEETVFKLLEEDDGWLKKPEPVASWHAYFSVYRALKFHRAAWETLRKAGYEPDPKWWWRPIKR
jgi:hypothetical protein